MEFKIRNWLGNIFLLALIHTAGATAISATPLSVLVNGGTIQVGDKLFSNFYYNVTPGNPGDTFSPNDPNGADINVTATTVAGNYGLTFTGPFSASGNGPLGFPNGAYYVITYDITVTDPSYTISDLHQSVGGTFSPGAFADLYTSVDPIHGPAIVGATLAALSSVAPTSSSSATLVSDYSSLLVDENLQTSTGGPNGSLTIPDFTVTFSQSPTGVVSPTPEPSALLLFGTGLLGLGIVLRNKLT